MSSPASYPPGICERRQPNAPSQHVISCSCGKCPAKITFTIHSRRKPPEQLHKMALRRGWIERKGFYFCPEHKDERH